MKKLSFVFLLFIAGLLSCNEDGSPLVQFWNTGNLPSQFFEININADTILHTKKGAEITIHKGDIRANTATIKLEVKEAYSIDDIVKAGLQTQSNGRALSSGGMIYLNLKDKEAQVIAPIKISMPSNNIEKDMQVFKGEPDKDGKMNWTDPQPLLPNKTLDSIEAGRNVFNQNCSSCHNPLKDATGTALIFMSQRLSKEWVKKWIHNSAEVIASGDPYGNCLYNAWGKTAMTAFPNLSDAELDMIYKYLDQEGKNKNPVDFPNYKARFDSCQVYLKAKAALQSKRDSLINDNGPEVEYVTLDTSFHIFEAPDNLVTPKADNSIYYQFTISGFGWYNVDAFAYKIPGFEPSKLQVKVSGPNHALTNIYVIIPESKVFVPGGLMAGSSDEYAFYTDDGAVPLPQGKQAYIMAFSEDGDKITFGFTRFITGLNNELTVTPEVVTKENMNAKIKEFKLEDINIEAHDSRNSRAIRKTDFNLQAIESLKPQGEDCNCGMVSESDSVVWK